MTTTITIPNVQLTIDQLVAVIRRLEPETRNKVAKALLAEEMDERLTDLIQSLANKPPVTDMTDEEINEEVRAVRRQRH
ncbi:MAG: hypothetical protein IPL78_19545 [Chloroflexi bacterium]|nr:hypothetical protein [Chloroflexota bacterium]